MQSVSMCMCVYRDECRVAKECKLCVVLRWKWNWRQAAALPRSNIGLARAIGYVDDQTVLQQQQQQPHHQHHLQRSYSSCHGDNGNASSEYLIEFTTILRPFDKEIIVLKCAVERLSPFGQYSDILLSGVCVGYSISTLYIISTDYVYSYSIPQSSLIRF